MVVGLILSAVHLTDGIGLGRWAGMAIAAVMAVCFLVFGAFSLVWTFSPNSRLEGESWITAGFPRIRHRALIIRTVGTVTLLLLGLALWEWLQ
jgi:hypothetical protein